MEVYMLFASLTCFAIAAVGGATLAFLYLSRGKTPIPLALLHGLLAVSGVTLLVISMSQGHTGLIFMAALALFLLAALGGLVMFTAHLRKRPMPVPILIAHAAFAVSGFLSLLAGTLGYAV
jgi:hypothetical protein